MTPEEFHRRLTGLGFTGASFARWVGAHKATVYRWLDGSAPVPGPIVRVIELLEERQRIAGAVAKLPA